MNFTKLATLTHVNLRAEGKDDKVLVMDAKFDTTLESVDLIEFHPVLGSMLWDPDGNPRFARLIDAVKLTAELWHHDVQVDDIVIDDARLHKFHLQPFPLLSAGVEFTVTVYPTAGLVARLSQLLQQKVELQVRAVPDLLTGLQDGVPKNVTLANGEKVTVTKNPGAAKSEKPARQKRPGGNRRQRVPAAEPDKPATRVMSEKEWPFPRQPNGRAE